MDKYEQAESKLAALLGWVYHDEGDRYGPRWTSPDGTWCNRRPLWCQNNAPAFALMVEHGCYPEEREDQLEDGKPCVHVEHWSWEFIENHPDKESAVRYAIVQAVIAKLEASRVTPNTQKEE